jgi:hypothetical protein
VPPPPPPGPPPPPPPPPPAQAQEDRGRRPGRDLAAELLGAETAHLRRERERERERKWERERVRVCVCERERERKERARVRERKERAREWARGVQSGRSGLSFRERRRERERERERERMGGLGQDVGQREAEEGERELWSGKQLQQQKASDSLGYKLSVIKGERTRTRISTWVAILSGKREWGLGSGSKEGAHTLPGNRKREGLG